MLSYGTVFDNISHLGYVYLTTTIRSKCDPTAMTETIKHAFEECAARLHKAKVVEGY